MAYNDRTPFADVTNDLIGLQHLAAGGSINNTRVDSFLSCFCLLWPADIMQGYFLKLLGTYSSFMYAHGVSPTPAALQSPGSSSNASMPPRSPSPHLGRRSSNVGSTGSLVASNEAVTGAAAASVCRPHSAGATGMARSSYGVPQRDESLSGHGYWFDHAGLVASHRSGEGRHACIPVLHTRLVL